MRIFITYAREDRAAVEALTADLTSLGHDVWYDAEIAGGQHWWDEILRRIAASDLYVFGISEPAVDSRPCLAELGYATAVLRPLLPVLLEPVAPSLMPPTLAEAQFVDYTNADKKSVFALNTAINRMPAATPLPDPLPSPPVIPPDPVALAKQRIDDPTELTRARQVELVDILGHELHIHGLRVDVAAVLRRFRARLDVMGDIRDRIDGLLAEVPAARAARSPVDAPRPVADLPAPAPEPEPEPEPADEPEPEPEAPADDIPPPPPVPPPRPRPAPVAATAWAAPHQPPAPPPMAHQPWTGAPPAAPAHPARWSGGFMAAMIALGVLCGGLVPLIVGLVNMSDHTKKDQAQILIWVGAALLVLSILFWGAGMAADSSS
jgi:serine/threonine kinase PknH